MVLISGRSTPAPIKIWSKKSCCLKSVTVKRDKDQCISVWTLLDNSCHYVGFLRTWYFNLFKSCIRNQKQNLLGPCFSCSYFSLVNNIFILSILFFILSKEQENKSSHYSHELVWSQGILIGGDVAECIEAWVYIMK